MGRHIALTMLIVAGSLLALACGSSTPAPTPTPAPPDGVLLPYPEEGKQYRMSEVCQHLEEQGYNVKGTVQYKVYADNLSGLLELIPALVREPIENYLEDGVGIEIEVRSLCKALNN